MPHEPTSTAKGKIDPNQLRTDLIQQLKDSPALGDEKALREQFLGLIPKMKEPDLVALKDLLESEKQDWESFLKEVESHQQAVLREAKDELKKIQNEATRELMQQEKALQAADQGNAEQLLDSFDEPHSSELPKHD